MVDHKLNVPVIVKTAREGACFGTLVSSIGTLLVVVWHMESTAVLANSIFCGDGCVLYLGYSMS